MASNPIFAILWFILLVFIAWPVAFFCAVIWVFLLVSQYACLLAPLSVHVLSDSLNFLYLSCSPLERASIAQGIVPMSLSNTPSGLATAEPLLLNVNLVAQSPE
jgi:hypothetical protein